MSKKSSIVSFSTPLPGKQSACEDITTYSVPETTDSEVEYLNHFRDNVFQLKEEVNCLCFMMSEIRECFKKFSGWRRSQFFSRLMCVV